MALLCQTPMRCHSGRTESDIKKIHGGGNRDEVDAARVVFCRRQSIISAGCCSRCNWQLPRITGLAVNSAPARMPCCKRLQHSARWTRASRCPSASRTASEKACRCCWACRPAKATASRSPSGSARRCRCCSACPPAKATASRTRCRWTSACPWTRASRCPSASGRRRGSRRRRRAARPALRLRLRRRAAGRRGAALAPCGPRRRRPGQQRMSEDERATRGASGVRVGESIGRSRCEVEGGEEPCVK